MPRTEELALRKGGPMRRKVEVKVPGMVRESKGLPFEGREDCCVVNSGAQLLQHALAWDC
jgi:hypothetical protein